MIAELMRILEQLAFRHVRAVTILGGETTIYRRDLPEILDRAGELGINVSLNTNLTAYPRIEPLLEKPALRSLIVSLDGASAATHDVQRGPGTFAKTVRNLMLVGASPRAQTRELLIQIAFVISGINCLDTPAMLPLATELHATHLNVKNVKLTGRAKENSGLLKLDQRQLLRAYSLLIVQWMLTRELELEVFVPPAFAVYLNRRFGLNFPTVEHHACGGTNVFSYVDLLGNHLPCPAMSFEESQAHGFATPQPGVNLFSDDIEATLQSPLFTEFESNRHGRVHIGKMFPCHQCMYRNQCVPCGAELIKGEQSDAVDICSAIHACGDEHVPGIRAELWGSPVQA